jgi:hypothetical protein
MICVIIVPVGNQLEGIVVKKITYKYEQKK